MLVAMVLGQSRSHKARLSPPHSRPYVLGWAAFRMRAGEPAHPSRMLPFDAATLIVDFTGPRHGGREGPSAGQACGLVWLSSHWRMEASS
jgi:hypothetical protein